jgi:hypothetical protein
VSDLTRGTVLANRFRIERELGVGGMAIVIWLTTFGTIARSR